jgi:hypothetical protein
VSAAACLAGIPVHAQQANEILASSTVIGDIEFDWARDGVYDPNANFGQGNARFNWTDRLNNLWVGHIDPTTGAFTPQQGQNELVDTHAFFWIAWGNGPEWAFSTSKGVIDSRLVYTRFVNNKQPVAGNAGAAFAAMVNGVWQNGFLPGAITPGVTGGAGNSALPEASQCLTDSAALTLYKNLATPQSMFTEPVNNAPGTVPTLTPFGSYANGIGERWIPCTHQLTFQGNAPPDSKGHVYQQVFWYDADTQAVQQLTTDPTGKQRAYMFQAPEFLNNPLNPNPGVIPQVLVAVSKNELIFVYLQTGTNSNGSPILTRINTIASPETAEPFIFDPKSFINCTPICQTYVVFSVSKTSTSQNGVTIPNGLAVANLNPAAPVNNLLISGLQLPAQQRLDPKFFITSNGPYVYYDLITVQSSFSKYKNLGTYYMDMLLGAPSGDCVGSSPLEGLNPNMLALDPMCVTP